MEQKEVTRTITKTTYIANDGTEFDSRFCCEQYEIDRKQENMEKEADKKLRIYTHANYPSMLNLGVEHEYRLFLIKNEEDLDLFIKTYKFWFNKLESYWQVDKRLFNYPEVLCVLDFPHGGDDYRLYILTQLINQFDAFVNEIQDTCNLILDDTSSEQIKTNKGDV